MQNNQELDNPQANPVEIGWLVGMIEAEGSFIMSIGNHGNQIQARMGFSNTDTGICDRFLAILKALGVSHYHISQRLEKDHFGKKPRLLIQVYRYMAVRRLMEVIMPYITEGVKKERAVCVDDFVRSRIDQLNIKDNAEKAYTVGKTNGERRYSDYQWSIFAKFQSLSETGKPQRA